MDSSISQFDNLVFNIKSEDVIDHFILGLAYQLPKESFQKILTCAENLYSLKSMRAIDKQQKADILLDFISSEDKTKKLRDIFIHIKVMGYDHTAQKDLFAISDTIAHLVENIKHKSIITYRLGAKYLKDPQNKAEILKEQVKSLLKECKCPAKEIELASKPCEICGKTGKPEMWVHKACLDTNSVPSSSSTGATNSDKPIIETKEPQKAQKSDSSSKHEDPECPICYEKIKDQDLEVTPCVHLFHSKCLENYRRIEQEMERDDVCPVCKYPMKEAENQITDLLKHKSMKLQEAMSGLKRQNSGEGVQANCIHCDAPFTLTMNMSYHECHSCDKIYCLFCLNDYEFGHECKT